MKRMATAKVGMLRLKQHRGSTEYPGEKPDTGTLKENIMQKGELYDRH